VESSNIALLLSNFLARFLQAFWHNVVAVLESVEVSIICGILFLSEKFEGLSVRCASASEGKKSGTVF
jgi:hypothetical protein